jgi:hypothetical protein
MPKSDRSNPNSYYQGSRKNNQGGQNNNNNQENGGEFIVQQPSVFTLSIDENNTKRGVWDLDLTSAGDLSQDQINESQQTISKKDSTNNVDVGNITDEDHEYLMKTLKANLGIVDDNGDDDGGSNPSSTNDTNVKADHQTIIHPPKITIQPPSPTNTNSDELSADNTQSSPTSSNSNRELDSSIDGGSTGQQPDPQQSAPTQSSPISTFDAELEAKYGHLGIKHPEMRKAYGNEGKQGQSGSNSTGKFEKGRFGGSFGSQGAGIGLSPQSDVGNDHNVSFGQFSQFSQFSQFGQLGQFGTDPGSLEVLDKNMGHMVNNPHFPTSSSGNTPPLIIPPPTPLPSSQWQANPDPNMGKPSLIKPTSHKFRDKPGRF